MAHVSWTDAAEYLLRILLDYFRLTEINEHSPLILCRLRRPFIESTMAPFDDETTYSDNEEQHQFLQQHDKPARNYTRPQRVCNVLHNILWALTTSLLTTLLVYTTLKLQHSSHSTQLSIEWSPCGSTPSEAKARGCKFDIISFAWLAPACYDAELSESFDELVDWEWFLDLNQTQPVSKAEALTGQYPVLYVDWDYHIRHCTFMWKKMHRAIMGPGKRAIDGYISPYEHTAHCAEMLLSGRELALDIVNTGIRVKYPDCGMA